MALYIAVDGARCLGDCRLAVHMTSRLDIAQHVHKRVAYLAFKCNEWFCDYSFIHDIYMGLILIYCGLVVLLRHGRNRWGFMQSCFVI